MAMHFSKPLSLILFVFFCPTLSLPCPPEPISLNLKDFGFKGNINAVIKGGSWIHFVDSGGGFYLSFDPMTREWQLRNGEEGKNWPLREQLTQISVNSVQEGKKGFQEFLRIYKPPQRNAANKNSVFINDESGNEIELKAVYTNNQVTSLNLVKAEWHFGSKYFPNTLYHKFLGDFEPTAYDSQGDEEVTGATPKQGESIVKPVPAKKKGPPYALKIYDSCTKSTEKQTDYPFVDLAS